MDPGPLFYPENLIVLTKKGSTFENHVHTRNSELNAGQGKTCHTLIFMFSIGNTAAISGSRVSERKMKTCKKESLLQREITGSPEAAFDGYFF